ncbi:related to Arginine permease [Saccharomycodes ludwigii]|uniref:Related to Arginine permease n=1 Tax=Saccharomycodes ludwigii TaxID=36035 RepID=A0A376B180_9ASCO|nr:related to Arginine permease [Saccharomycodes ludwigii]
MDIEKINDPVEFEKNAGKVYENKSVEEEIDTLEDRNISIERSGQNLNGNNTIDLCDDNEKQTILIETDDADVKKLKRGLSPRIVAMTSLGGTLGTGIFFSISTPLQTSGPVNTLISYSFVGVLAFFVTQSLGEMATFIPVTSSFIVFVQRFCSKSAGAAVGYMYLSSWAICYALEVSVVGSIINYWTDVVPLAGWNIIAIAVTFAINFMPVRVYGEVEFWIALIKVVAIVGFIIFGLVMVCGGSKKQGPIGFRYWRNPGPWGTGIISRNKNEARFLGWVNALISGVFSMEGVETVGIQAGEAANPRKTVPKAINRVFIRILLFYILTLFFIGMIVPYNDPHYQNTDSSYIAASPFLIAIEDCGIRVLPHIFNAVILTTVLSGANSSLYLSSRIIYGLSQLKLLPAFLTKSTRSGVPVYSVIFAAAFGFLAYLQCGSATSQQTFNWFLNISSCGSSFAWIFINISYIRFAKALKYQGISRDDLPFKAKLMPFGAYFAAFFNTIIVFIQGFTAFCPWNVSNFFAYYISNIIFGIIWVGGTILSMLVFTKTGNYRYSVKFEKKPIFIEIENIDLNTNRRDIDLEVWENDEEKPKTFFCKILSSLT